MKFAALSAMLGLAMLLSACHTGEPLHEPVSDRVMRDLDKASLKEEAFAQALTEKGIKPVRTAPASEVRWPFQMVNGVPRIYCRINGRRSVPLIFDTGASHTMLNVADALKLKVLTLHADSGAVPMIGVMGVEQGRLGVIELLEMGAWKIRGYPCLIRTHQNGIRSLTASRFFQPNLLGFDLAAESASYLTVDYRRGEIIYGFGQRYEPTATATGRVSKTSFRVASGVPFTRVSVGGEYWDALIDTGSFNGIEVSTQLAKRLQIHDRSKPVEGLSVFGVGGSMSSAAAGMRVVTVPQLAAGGMIHQQAEVDISPGPPRIGSFFLKDYRVTFDLRRKLLWLE